MEAYEGFAAVYDMFMEETDYDMWVEYIKKIWKKENCHPKLIADLGCGTGNVTQILAREGYDVIGIDFSEDMLAEAKKKAEAENLDILYLLQDMREFELYGTVRAVVSVCDSMNYITDEEDLLQVFRLVSNYLDPGGIFIFDLNTVHKYRDILGDATIAENREECSFIWENDFDEEEGINEYDLTLFIRREDEDLYEKYEETHYQRAYSRVS